MISINNSTSTNNLSCYLIGKLAEMKLNGNHSAFISTTRKVSYEEFVDSCFSFARYISENNALPSCVIVGKPSPEWAIAYFAVLLSGKTAILAEPNCADISGMVHNYSAGLIISDGHTSEAISVPIVDIKSLQEYCLHKSNESYVQKKANEISTIIFTSGTTGNRKGVALSLRNIISDALSSLELYPMHKSDRVLNILPYYHGFGLCASLLAPLLSGSTVCFGKSIGSIISDVKAFSPTLLNIVPSVAKELLPMLSTYPSLFSPVRKILCGGAPLENAVENQYAAAGVDIYSCYGLSECSPCISINSELLSKPGSVGKPISCNEVQIYDGEILVKGSNVMLGYYDGSSIDKSSINDGWLHTGDMGYFDSEGFLFVTGRKKDLIVFDNGEKLSPVMIESMLNSYADIKESVVFLSEKTKKLHAIVTPANNCCFFNIEAAFHEVNDTLPTYAHMKYSISDKPLKRNTLGKLLRGEYT